MKSDHQKRIILSENIKSAETEQDINERPIDGYLVPLATDTNQQIAIQTYVALFQYDGTPLPTAEQPPLTEILPLDDASKRNLLVRLSTLDANNVWRPSE